MDPVTTTDTCERCRAIGRVLADLIQGAGPTATSVSGGVSVSVDEFDARVRSLVLLKRAYERDLPSNDEDTVEYEHKRGIVAGMQIAVDKLCAELGVEVHDPPPPRTRKRTRVASSSTRVEDGSTAATRRSVRATGATGTEDLTKAQAAILRAAVQRHPRSSTDAQLAVLGGYSVTSSSFSNAVSALRCAGYLSGAPTSRLATKDGVERADHVEKMPRGPALIAFWQGKIQKAEAVILGTIVDMTRNTAGDAPLDKQVIANESRYSIASSSFSNALSKLRTLRLIDRATHRCVEELRR